jgi:DNA helicase-2/ATP-dependent DNA helicase PcrA
MKNDGLDQSDLEFSAKTPTEKLAAEVWPIYQKKMDELNALDFDDLISKVVQLFQHFSRSSQAYYTELNLNIF